jgi:hypothetical protein
MKNACAPGRSALASQYSPSSTARHQNVTSGSPAAIYLLTDVSDPYPFAIDECFDVYRALCMSAGRCIGMSGKKLNIILTGDSA